MTRSRGVHGVVLAGLVLATAAVTTPARGQGRPITERDLLAFHWVADPQISPDGSVIAYTLVSVSDKDNRYETAVWMVPTRAPSGGRYVGGATVSAVAGGRRAAETH
jgi:hypothetical protein